MKLKKIILAFLCTAALCTAVLAGTSSVTALSDNSQEKHYSVISSKTITIPDNQFRVYTSGLTNDSCIGSVKLVSDDESWTTKTEECIDDYKFTSTSAGKDYRIAMICGGMTITSSKVSTFDKTGGTYEWVRFKIYDFADESSEFNEDGTVTKELFEDTHTYNFTREDNRHISMLLIISGAAVTVAAPDEDGYVEAYVSTNLGDDVWFKTNYKSQINGAGGGGKQENLLGLAAGDTDQSGSIGISDATEIQKYIAEVVNFDSLSKRAADVNHDRKIDISDVTAIQKCIAGLEY